LLFIKPLEEQQTFEEFIEFVSQQGIRAGTSNASGENEVRYAQTREFVRGVLDISFRELMCLTLENDNLRNEYATLFSHVEKDIPWARIALQQVPEAINLWIGNSLSITALHKDNYENIYVQVIGQKHFVLLPPLDYACVNEQKLPPASYSRRGDGALEIVKEDGDDVPFATWDPDRLGNETAYSELAEPMRVTLMPGDMLYLPALW
jgi:jumonji domain-containing protein 7